VEAIRRKVAVIHRNKAAAGSSCSALGGAGILVVMSRSRRFAVIALLGIAGLIALAVACGGSDLKQAGDSCNASSECASGLVCDFGREPHVCASMSTQQMPDAPDETPDAATDARPDARPDAAIDAPPPVDAPPDAPVDVIDAM
jgi:hypothetical protein